MIKQLGLQQHVTLDTRFLDREFVHAELARADIAVLPYERSNEGGSGTAADCIAVGLPLVVSDAEIFDEIRDVALTTAPNAASIADTILRVLSNADLYDSLADRSFSYAKANSWESIVGGLLAPSLASSSSLVLASA